MEPIKGDGVVVEFGRKFIMHTGHGANGCLRFSEETWTRLNRCVFINEKSKK